jgi:hypothetical protein
MENGVQKRVSEPYLVDALSFTEAEARITEKIKHYVTGEFKVTNIKTAKLSELFFNAKGDRYYRAKLYFISLDEKSGAEKKSVHHMMVQANDLREAITLLDGGMKGSMVDYAIASVTETLIMDVFPFDGTIPLPASEPEA